MHACTHTTCTLHTHTHKLQSKTAEIYLFPPSELALGCLCTSQVLASCTDKSSWGRTTVQVSKRGCKTCSSTMTPLPLTETCFPIIPLMLQLGGLLPQLTTPTRHKQALSLEPFEYQADTLATRLCCLTTRTHLHTLHTNTTILCTCMCTQLSLWYVDNSLIWMGL